MAGGARVQTAPELSFGKGPDPQGLVEIDVSQRRQLSLLTRPNEVTPTQVEAEQLLWANLWKGGAVVEGRWRFAAADGVLDAVQVDVEGDFELISAAALSPASVAWTPKAG